ncbi:MAG: hypothetical protein ABSF78_08175 [Candidatus Acidiferrales bacterium]|jgi:hypothetical protein
MPNSIDTLIDAFASKLELQGVRIEKADNSALLEKLESGLPKKLPQSFESLLLRYSFPTFGAGGITFFGWESDSSELFHVLPPNEGTLSELLLPAGYIQIGRPDTGNFDAVCFDLNTAKQNREYRIVRAAHEEILCNFRVSIVGEVWPSFSNLVEFCDMDTIVPE